MLSFTSCSRSASRKACLSRWTPCDIRCLGSVDQMGSIDRVQSSSEGSTACSSRAPALITKLFASITRIFSILVKRKNSMLHCRSFSVLDWPKSHPYFSVVSPPCQFRVKGALSKEPTSQCSTGGAAAASSARVASPGGAAAARRSSFASVCESQRGTSMRSPSTGCHWTSGSPVSSWSGGPSSSSSEALAAWAAEALAAWAAEALTAASCVAPGSSELFCRARMLTACAAVRLAAGSAGPAALPQLVLDAATKRIHTPRLAMDASGRRLRGGPAPRPAQGGKALASLG
mmetsp:Transcript_75250/g.228059  ORF Transcript_75250/g.228059 Transcript_75250/m.228059 type:complete len:289 (-) Transcript_75250:49-915(-)